MVTALGIIFGVAAVVAMLSIGEGARQESLEQIRLMGVNNIIIRSKEVTAQSLDKSRANFSPGLTALDADAITAVSPQVDYIVTQWEKTAPAMFRSERRDVKVIGTTPAFLEAFGYRVQEGTFLQQSHARDQSNVCVIGSGIKNAMFHFHNPVGQQLKIDNQWFTVIGIMESQMAPAKKITNMDVRNLNMDVYIPLTTAQYKLERFKSGGSGGMTFMGGGMMFNSSGDRTAIPRDQQDQITVKVVSEEWIGEATTVVQRILSRRHFGVGDFEVIVPEALLQQSQKTQQIFNVVMERTKEIGVRRAVGATRADVLGQFLFEAMFLSIVGGLLVFS